jgi:RNA polymerase sigma-70 factor (ECF subfamily)
MAKMSEDLALVERFRRGDDSAFDRIVERYSAEVAALAHNLLGWPRDVDDIVQEVFVAAFLGLKSFRGDCSLRAWLFTITLNKCRSYHRYRRMLRLRATAMADAEAAQSTDEAGAEKDVVDHETFARVRSAVRALPPKYREVVVLRYLEGLETSDICGLLGISVSAFNMRLNRARKRLRGHLTELIEDKS